MYAHLGKASSTGITRRVHRHGVKDGRMAKSWTNEDLLQTPLLHLMEAAADVRNKAYPQITFSPKVFIPLTRLCRDACGYCTFATPPVAGRRAFMTLEEVLQVARLGVAQGCAEALFTLGDKPEESWAEVRLELAGMGFSSTLEYVEAAARAVLLETGLLPHINAGVMDVAWLKRLKAVCAGQGLMIESTSPALMALGGAHSQKCPDKEPTLRLQAIEDAGCAQVPYTTGLLVGIGESRQDRLEDLRHIQRLHGKYGHIQEVIIQNFRAKKGTAMAAWAEPSLEELQWTVAAARLILSPSVSLQAPPNLTPDSEDSHHSKAANKQASWRALLDAGINDWGGISPLTADYVNPECSWPHLGPLAEATAAAGFVLVPRLTVYSRYQGLKGAMSHQGPIQANTIREDGMEQQGKASEGGWVNTDGGARSVRAAVLRLADSGGFVRGSTWYAGIGEGGESQDDDGKQGQERESLVSEKLLDDFTSNSADASSKVVKDAATAAARAVAIARTQDADVSSRTLEAQPAAMQLSETFHKAAMPGSRRSIPAVQVHKRAWLVKVGENGALLGYACPSAPSPRVVQALAKVRQHADSIGSAWLHSTRKHMSTAQSWSPSPQPAETRNPLSWEDITVLLESRGADFEAVVQAADQLRAEACGNEVAYVVNRNINNTNKCTYKCTFCAFSKGKAAEELRGPSYLVPLEEISRRAAEAWDRGATEVCIQGGIHPDFTGHSYLEVVRAAKAGAPNIHVHAFSPLEVSQGAKTLGLSHHTYLGLLKKAGLGSLPGTAAEVLCDDVRSVLCPDKLSSKEWVQVVEAAHQVGLRTTSTLMFGHLEHGPQAWATHLKVIRDLQERTGGFTEFVPLPFVHPASPVYLKGNARRGPTLHECILLHAVSRLALYPSLLNIQASWVKMGPDRAAQLLNSGCNDMGGTLMNESITRAAGASHGQELTPLEMEQLIGQAGRVSKQRTTLYGPAPKTQTEKSHLPTSLLPLKPLVYS